MPEPRVRIYIQIDRLFENKFFEIASKNKFQQYCKGPPKVQVSKKINVHSYGETGVGKQKPAKEI